MNAKDDGAVGNCEVVGDGGDDKDDLDVRDGEDRDSCDVRDGEDRDSCHVRDGGDGFR